MPGVKIDVQIKYPGVDHALVKARKNFYLPKDIWNERRFHFGLLLYSHIIRPTIAYDSPSWADLSSDQMETMRKF